MKELADAATITTEQMRALVHKKYGGVHWLVIDELRDATGFASTHSTDVVAVGMYASRGFEFHGVEIKVSRSDWLHELNSPGKNDAVASQCDKWWIAAPKGIVEKDELPEGWGLYTPSGRGLRVTVKPRKRKNADAFTRPLVASLLQRVSKAETPGHKALKDEYDRGYKDGKKRGWDDSKWSTQTAERRARDAESAIEQFEKASGVHINDWNSGRVGEAVKALEDLRHERRASDLIGQIERVKNAATATIGYMDVALEELRKLEGQGNE